MMLKSTFAVALFSTLIFNTNAQSSVSAAAGAIQTLGCYSTGDPLAMKGSYTYQTSGYCQTLCASANAPVMATTQGSTCYCGDTIPALDKMVSNSSCNTPCNGFDQQMCGGLNYWTVYLTGLNTQVETAPNSTTSSSSKGSASTPAVVTKPGETVVVTAASDANTSSGPNKVGIAVGVVVGVVGLAALVGGFIFFMKRRRNQEIEEEHRRNAAISAFVADSKSETNRSQDSRLDPSVFSHRRESIGSIADERDFSRRILQVSLHAYIRTKCSTNKF